ncbi:PilZ domain-containing protein [Marinobacterium arenosum]|uniref:PilZ domain-containing protein n=1 Tax=Marinobacterium arenosum TaxID=2862496 RepID=UPI001C9526D6|nr:PilZ domain-containing protein [Marinobacterium arenosum]MBY4678028.1 PilZ domain-containing protein [Marinobacterium arenosum]
MSAERRLHPRVDVSLPVEVCNSWGATVVAQLVNLSVGGLLVSGDQRLAELYSPEMGSGQSLTVSFSLEGQPLLFDCRVVYKRRLSQSAFEFGLQFCWLDDYTRNRLTEYVDQRLLVTK